MASLRVAKLSDQKIYAVMRTGFPVSILLDVKGLRKAVAWCWEAASRTSGSVESYLRTSADHLLGS